MKKLILLVVIFLTFSCGQIKDEELVVTASPKGGVFTDELSVALGSNISSTIYYRIVPKESASLVAQEFIVYQEPVSITDSSTLEFYGESSESVSRRVAEAYEEEGSISADHFTFEACVDGSDLLEVVNGQFTITHRNFDEIGKHFECPENYSDTEEGYFVIDDQVYHLSDLPIPAPFQQISKFSVISGRGTVSMKDNAVLIDDDEISSSSMYTITIYGESLEPDPDPIPEEASESTSEPSQQADDEPEVEEAFGTSAYTNGDYIVFEACVDGSDYVKVDKAQLEVEHVYYEEVGKHFECEEGLSDPAGKFVVDSVDYLLTDSPVTVAIPQIKSFIVLSGRGTVTLDNLNRLLINDDAFSGSATYVIKLIWEK